MLVYLSESSRRRKEKGITISLRSTSVSSQVKGLCNALILHECRDPKVAVHKKRRARRLAEAIDNAGH